MVVVVFRSTGKLRAFRVAPSSRAKRARLAPSLGLCATPTTAPSQLPPAICLADTDPLPGARLLRASVKPCIAHISPAVFYSSTTLLGSPATPAFLDISDTSAPLHLLPGPLQYPIDEQELYYGWCSLALCFEVHHHR